MSYYFIPSVNRTMKAILAAFASGDFTVVGEFVKSYGVYAAAVSFLLMILQSIAAPLPAFLLTFANANLFGWWKGAVLSWSSAMAGAAVCFFIARILGRDVVERLTSKTGLKQIDEFFEKHGKMSILIARLLPFISFDIVSYAAGLTSVSFGSFFIATGIGQLPATIIYSYVGSMLTGGARLFVTGLLLLFAISALVVLLKQIYKERQKKEENSMETKQIAEEFMKGYDCSQVVLRYFADRLGISEDEANRVSAGFGGGMLMGSVCGAYTGALMAVGLKYGHSNPDGLLKQKDVMAAKAGQLQERFIKEFGTVECKKLIGYDVSTPEGLQGALESGKMMGYCPELVGKVIQMTEEILGEDD